MGADQEVLRAAMTLAQKHNCFKLVVSSSLRRPRAHNFYKKLGFKQHGISFSIKLPSTPAQKKAPATSP